MVSEKGGYFFPWVLNVRCDDPKGHCLDDCNYGSGVQLDQISTPYMHMTKISSAYQFLPNAILGLTR
jgi:hypothetical protein